MECFLKHNTVTYNYNTYYSVILGILLKDAYRCTTLPQGQKHEMQTFVYGDGQYQVPRCDRGA